MVNPAVIQNIDQSLASYEGVPSLTINHEATIDLDSSNAFEGPEKLLEVWFAPSPDDMVSSEPCGLRAVPVDVWKGMLDLVNCKVLSIVQGKDVDAYLLSESSMFVWPHKLILKTCGTTTLLFGLPKMLEIAALFGGFPHSSPPAGLEIASAPYRVFYSRKNYMFPDKQRGPHRSWKDEVRTLDNYFQGGSAYMIGKMNGEHWYLYVTEPHTPLTPPASPQREPIIRQLKFPHETTGFNAGRFQHEKDDETLEILMTDLDEENAKQFYLDHASAVAKDRHCYLLEEKNETSSNFSYVSDDGSADSLSDRMSIPPELTTEGHTLGTVVAESSGLADVYPVCRYPDTRIDAYLFTPCGFSANGVVPAPDRESGTHYFTVHVTPEPHCSYASFETNVPQGQNGRETHDIIEHVAKIFKPGRFTVTLFETKTHLDDEESDDELGFDALALRKRSKIRNAKMDRIPGYRRLDRIVHNLDGYDLVFRHYERENFRGGGAPRIGEAA